MQLSLMTGQQKEQFLSHWYGGEKSLGQRKRKRPFARRKAMHLVMRSTRARGEWNFLLQKNRAKLQRILNDQSKKNSVTVIKFANVGNHLHLIIKADTREGLGNFLRTFAALTARAITGARKGRPLSAATSAVEAPKTRNVARKKFKFWNQVAFTRVLGSNKEFVRGLRYLWLNEVEGEFGQKARSLLSEWLQSNRRGFSGSLEFSTA